MVVYTAELTEEDILDLIEADFESPKRIVLQDEIPVIKIKFMVE